MTWYVRSGHQEPRSDRFHAPGAPRELVSTASQLPPERWNGWIADGATAWRAMNAGDSPGRDRDISSLDVVALPWVFTQHQPLSTSEFIRAARDRGVDLNKLQLRQLYKRGLLIPFVMLTGTQQTCPRPVTAPEPAARGTWLVELRAARNDGRLVDLAEHDFQPRQAFTRPRNAKPGWWNGLLYSHHQLVMLPHLVSYLSHCRYSYRHGQVYPRLPEPGAFLAGRAPQYRRIAVMAAALEARYLPVIDREYVQLINAEIEEYEAYRAAFDPIAMSSYLRYPPEIIRRDAQELLYTANLINPLDGPLDQLMRRLPRDSWQYLKGPAQSVMDLRTTAEILLRFYEDLAERGLATPLEITPSSSTYPHTERLTDRPGTLDQDLMAAGLSPHYGVVLAVEGETEFIHAPGVLALLGPSDAEALVHITALEGADQNPVLVGALAATPKTTRQSEDGRYWWVMRPPTKFMVVTDPEGFYAPDKISGTKANILNMIQANLLVRGVKTDDQELEALVELRTWDESCYEFAHFSDDELADAIMKIHTTIDGWTRTELVGALKHWREKKKDIKRVWLSGKPGEASSQPSGRWAYEVSKTKLAEALWPLLKAKIEQAKTDEKAPVPPIALVIVNALNTAARWRHKSFVLKTAD